jgi:hypothetical protein
VTKHWIGALACVAAFGLLVASGWGMLAALFLLPLFAWYASRIIVHGGFGIWNYATHVAKAEWNGRHYEFGGARLRAEETDDELVFLEEDLLAVIEQPDSKTVQLFGPKERFLLTNCDEMALTQAGCERLLVKCPHRDAKKLMLFLQREAFYPHQRRHGKLNDRMQPGDSKTTNTATKPANEERA